MPYPGELPEKQREHWFRMWMYYALAAEKTARIPLIIHLLNQIQINGGTFDLHINRVSPEIEGGIMTTPLGLQMFENIEELLDILSRSVKEMIDASGNES